PRGRADTAAHREPDELAQRRRPRHADMDRQVDARLGGARLPVRDGLGIEAELGYDADLEARLFREIGLRPQNFRRLRTDGLAAFRVPGDADRLEAVLAEEPGLEHL